MLINKAFDFMKECLEKDNSGHGVEHIKRVIKNAENPTVFGLQKWLLVLLLSFSRIIIEL